MKKTDLLNAINNSKANSCWAKGVKLYALELVEWCELENYFVGSSLLNALLNGAGSWKNYSFGGCALIYDWQIAERLCNKTELKKTRNGLLEPNKNESWLDVQARALFQAYLLINRLLIEA